MLCKKYFHEYWNQGGREHAFMKAKQKNGESRLSMCDFGSLSFSPFLCFLICSVVLFCFVVAT
jgi:hypothetical protein